MVSALTVLEVRSAIRRRERMGDIAPSHAGQALETLRAEIARIVEFPITPSVTSEAARLIDGYTLRALDAIQLATAVVARGASLTRLEMVFITSDTKLGLAAVAEGFPTWNPASGSAIP